MHNPMKVATYESDMKAVITTLCTTTFQLKSRQIITRVVTGNLVNIKDSNHYNHLPFKFVD